MNVFVGREARAEGEKGERISDIAYQDLRSIDSRLSSSSMSFDSRGGLGVAIVNVEVVVRRQEDAAENGLNGEDDARPANVRFPSRCVTCHYDIMVTLGERTCAVAAELSENEAE